jgi:hypothetical protein
LPFGLLTNNHKIEGYINVGIVAKLTSSMVKSFFVRLSLSYKPPKTSIIHENNSATVGTSFSMVFEGVLLSVSDVEMW